MATVVVQHHQDPLRHSPTPPPITASLTLNIPRSSTPIPNKHLPYCPPGPAPSSSQIITPPNSPPTRNPPCAIKSILHPPTAHPKLLNFPPIYGIDAGTLASALEEHSKQLLPDPQQVFPWLHGLHPENQIQMAFFVARKKSLRKVPKCLRGITIVKAGGDMTISRLKGAVAADEILSLSDDNDRGFLDCDPKEGFSVRNFGIQTAKWAQVSDIVIYADDSTDQRLVKSIAERTAVVQRKWKKHLEASGQSPETYHTFVCTTPFDIIERDYPALVAVDSRGVPTGRAMDFLQWERSEMCTMSRASEFADHVYQGPTPDEDIDFDILIEASDQAFMPENNFLNSILEALPSRTSPVHLHFPSSGSLFPSSPRPTPEVDGIVNMCRFMYQATHPTPRPASRSSSCADEEEKEEQIPNADGDIAMTDLSSPSLSSAATLKPKKILIHCVDGYTESSLLTVAYYMYAECLPVHSAWTRLHVEKGRNFFAYPSDVSLLTSIQNRLLAESPLSPASSSSNRKVSIPPAPSWLSKLDGSLPSRILPYMYLGNLTHANNPSLLRELGIKRILSVGEPVTWEKGELERWGFENLLMVDKVQDNGIDPLTREFERCLGFIGMLVHLLFSDTQLEINYVGQYMKYRLLTIIGYCNLGQGKSDGSATLVHCRVGVSRSATICIAEVMASQGLSFPRA